MPRTASKATTRTTRSRAPRKESRAQTRPAPSRSRRGSPPAPSRTTRRGHANVAEPSIRELRSLENPSTPLSAPDDWLFDAMGSYRASSGVNVNSQTALTLSAFWRAVNLISGDTGRLPLYKYKRVGRGRERDARHYLYSKLRWKPNSEMMAGVWKKTMTGHAITAGNGYSWISRDGYGRVLELIPLNPTQIYPVRRNGELWYIIDIPTVEIRKASPRDIFHLKGLSYDGLIGYSVIAKARESLGLAMAIQTHSSVFFRNNAQPRVVLVHPNTLKPETKLQLRENWERLHAGLENAHRTALLDGGVDIKTIQNSAKDAQLVDAMQASVRDIANWFSLPPHKVGDTTRTSFSSLEQENQQYLDEGLMPWLHAWEEECWDKLLTDDEKKSGDHFFEFDTRQLLRANLSARGTYYVQAVTNGWMSPDEVREEEGNNPRTDPDGAKFAQNTSNMTWVGGSETDDEDDSPAAAQADANGTELLDLPDIRQQDTYSCGAACAMSVGRYFGVGPETLEEWRTALGTTPKDSTRPMAIVQYLSELGLAVTAAHNLTIKDLQGYWKRGMPVICCIQEYGVPGKEASFNYGHYVAVIGVALGQVFVQDPSLDDVLEGEDSAQTPGRSMIDQKTWLDIWHDQDVDGKQYIRFGIAVGKEALPEPPAPEEKPGTDQGGGSVNGSKPKVADDKKGVAADGQANRSTEEQEELRTAHHGLMVDTFRRLVKRITNQARSAAKDSGKFTNWLKTLDADNFRTLSEAIDPIAFALPGHLTSAGVAGVLIGELRSHFERVQSCQPLLQEVNRLAAIAETILPGLIAEEVLDGEEARKTDKPARTAEQALNILDRLPDADPDKPGQIALTMPVNEDPPYEVRLDDLKGLKKKTVRIRELIGTRATLKRKRVADFIRNPKSYTKGRELQNLPTDQPYVIEVAGNCYIYDGHHRAMGLQLLGVAKTKAYYLKLEDRCRRYDPNQPRDPSGKFSSGGGQGGSDDLHAKATDAAKSWGDRLQELPAKIASAAANKVQSTYAKLESRYGKGFAVAIMGDGLLGVPVPAPGASLLTAAPVIAAAELYRHFRGERDDHPTAPELSDADLHKIGHQWMQALLTEWQTQDLPELTKED